MVPLEGLAIAVVLLATVTDLLEHRIYNVLTGPAMLAGILGHAVLGTWWEGLAACVAIGLPFFLLYAFNVLKAGDVKLYMAVGALLGLEGGAIAAYMSLLAWVPIGIGILVVNGRLRELRTVFNKEHKPLLVPFGAAIAAGTIVSLYLRGR